MLPNPTERELVDTLIHNEWRLRRMRRVEAVLWEHAANTYLAQHPDEPACNSAHAFITNSGAFERLQRIVNACERNYHRALKELVARGHARRSSQPEESNTTSPDIGPFRQNPNPPEPTPPPAPKNSPETRAKGAKEAADAQALADEDFRIRRQAMFEDAMARFGKK